MMVPLLLMRVHLLTSTLITQNSVTFCLPHHHQVPLLAFLSPSSKQINYHPQQNPPNLWFYHLQTNEQKFLSWDHKIFHLWKSDLQPEPTHLFYVTLSCHFFNAYKLFVWRKSTWMVAFHRSSPALRLLLEVLLSSSHLATYRTTLRISLNLPGPHFFPRGCAKLFLSFFPAPGLNYFILTVLNVL